MAEKKDSWWVHLGHFLDRIWAIFQHAMFTYTTGNDNKIVNITGEQITFDGPQITITFEHPIFLNNKGLKLLHKTLEKEVNKQAWLSAYFADKILTKAHKEMRHGKKEMNHGKSLHDTVLSPDADSGDGVREPPASGEQGS